MPERKERALAPGGCFFKRTHYLWIGGASARNRFERSPPTAHRPPFTVPRPACHPERSAFGAPYSQGEYGVSGAEGPAFVFHFTLHETGCPRCLALGHLGIHRPPPTGLSSRAERVWGPVFARRIWAERSRGTCICFCPCFCLSMSLFLLSAGRPTPSPSVTGNSANRYFPVKPRLPPKRSQPIENTPQIFFAEFEDNYVEFAILVSESKNL